MNVGIFGGSFNPPHVSHVLTVGLVLCTEEIDEVVVIPTFKHPFSKPLAPYEDRVAMSEAAMAWLPRVRVSRIEEELGGDSLTLRTLQRLQSDHPSWRMRLIMGSDLVVESVKWFGFDRIRAIAPPLVVGRVGFEGAAIPSAVLPPISSTEVRAMIGAGRWTELSALLPRAVLAHIRDRGLYGERDGDGDEDGEMAR